jgi:hypothetical protein
MTKFARELKDLYLSKLPRRFAKVLSSAKRFAKVLSSAKKIKNSTQEWEKNVLMQMFPQGN